MTRTLLLATLLACTCAHAQDGPTRFFPDDLGQDGRISLAPGFAPDGNTLYFSQSEGSPIWKYPQRLKVSTRTATGWTPPTLVPLPRNPDLETSEPRVDSPTVSPDGTTLLFSWSAPRPEYADRDMGENFDLYTLDLTDPDAVPRPIPGDSINSRREGAIKRTRYIGNENSPHLTVDGHLYFWTERLDAAPGFGRRDVYMAPSDGQGGFLEARPLPAPINSPGEDGGSFITPDGRILLVAYRSRGGEGGADLFISVKTDGQWATPVPLGPSVNSSADEYAGRITPDGQTLVFNSTRAFDDTPEGLIQIWSVPVADVPILAAALEKTN